MVYPPPEINKYSGVYKRSDAYTQYANQKSNELERNMKKLIIAWWKNL